MKYNTDCAMNKSLKTSKSESLYRKTDCTMAQRKLTKG